jgi:hypothetical protein
MKKIFFLIPIMATVTTIAANAQATKQVYKSPKLNSLVGRAKKVAILPLNVSISYKKLPKGVTVENIREDEKKESIQLQQGMFTFLLRKANNYTVAFQDVETTNALLKGAGVFESLNETTPELICKILDVDAIIKSSWSYSKTGSEAGALVSMVVLGVSKNTASGQLIMQIYEAKEGELMWRMAKEMNEGTFSSANELMEKMMRKVGRNFPFEK